MKADCRLFPMEADRKVLEDDHLEKGYEPQCDQPQSPLFSLYPERKPAGDVVVFCFDFCLKKEQIPWLNAGLVATYLKVGTSQVIGGHEHPPHSVRFQT